MFMNSENTKLIDYLKLKNMYRYANAYLQFLGTGKKLDKKSIKILLKNIRSGDLVEFEKNMVDIFSKFEINVTVQHKKNTLPKSSSIRVKKHRENIKAKGYKNLSLELPADQYKKLKDLKIKKNMTYSELITFLISDKN